MGNFRRDKLQRLAKEGKLVMVGSYHFDDMYGADRQQSVELPVVYIEEGQANIHQEGICYVHEYDFTGQSGHATQGSNGNIHLHVHSNHNVDFRIKDWAKVFAPGTPVVMSRVCHADVKGQTGTAKRYIKSRNVVEVELSNGTRYDAIPNNLDVVKG